MTKIEFISLATVPVTLLATAAIVFVSVALATKKSRLETVRAIQSKNFGANHFSTIGGLWALYFHFLFGDRILAKRQALTIPLYTLVVSGIFFLIWVIYLYIFRNPTHSFSANLPMSFKQAANDFYHKGIIATLLIDFTTIQLTKMAIRTGAKSGYYSIRFAVTFFTTLAIAYFIFSLAVFYFRVEDMVRLYIELAPNDPIPIMPYAPFANMASSLSLFYPQTIIHVTTQGLFSTYFMPEPLIFYCAVTAQVSLLSITLGYQIAAGLERLKNLCISLVRSVGTPQVNAYSVIFLVILGLISIPIIALSFLAIVSSK
jgi:hypothetical protein